MENKMFCYQCQETAGCTGCTKVGVCGKTKELSYLQDLLVYVTKGLCETAALYYKEDTKIESDVTTLVIHNLFTTITNANFDEAVMIDEITATLAKKRQLLSLLSNKEGLSQTALWDSLSEADYMEKSQISGVLSTNDSADIRSLKELIIYGLKGLCAYLKHALALGYENHKTNKFLIQALASTLDDSLDAGDLLTLSLEVGAAGVEGMALLDEANTSTFGNPQITTVSLGVRNNPAILISGHDLNDLKELLDQTKGSGVDVYTHCEMLPAHYYPIFADYDNLAGNYGNAWWKQKEEFESFNGPILMTTNCIVPPKDSYKDRMYTTGAAGYPGCTHITKENGSKDFSQLIEKAKQCKSPEQIETGEIVGGFAHNQVIVLADKVVDAVKSGAIKEFVVMAGCDGRSKSREYYTDYAKNLPQDSVILTAGCAKYRYNKLNLGDIGGIPRVLDAGQCNDSYSLVVIALKLKEAFGLENINDLPIKYNIAWYEQKAVIVLLSLLHLGVKNINLGPTLPAFLSENVAGILIKDFGITNNLA